MEALTAAPSPAGFVFNRAVGEGGSSKNSMKLAVILPTGLEPAPGSSAFVRTLPPTCWGEGPRDPVTTQVGGAEPRSPFLTSSQARLLLLAGGPTLSSKAPENLSFSLNADFFKSWKISVHTR